MERLGDGATWRLGYSVISNQPSPLASVDEVGNRYFEKSERYGDRGIQ